MNFHFNSHKFKRSLEILLSSPGFFNEDTMTDDSYFNISEIKLSITTLFSVQIMSHLGVSDVIYSDVIDSFITEIFL